MKSVIERVIKCHYNALKDEPDDIWWKDGLTAKGKKFKFADLKRRKTKNRPAFLYTYYGGEWIPATPDYKYHDTWLLSFFDEAIHSNLTWLSISQVNELLFPATLSGEFYEPAAEFLKNYKELLADAKRTAKEQKKIQAQLKEMSEAENERETP